MSDGDLDLDTEDPSKINSTETGQRFASGVVALSHCQIPTAQTSLHQ